MVGARVTLDQPYDLVLGCAKPFPCSAAAPLSSQRPTIRRCADNLSSRAKTIGLRPPRSVAAPSSGWAYLALELRLTRPRSAAKHMVMLIAPTIAMAAAAWPSWVHCQP